MLIDSSCIAAVSTSVAHNTYDGSGANVGGTGSTGCTGGSGARRAPEWAVLGANALQNRGRAPERAVLVASGRQQR